ncbi:MAG: TatD family hydrolase [Candidatus Peribacteria bacterium]|nr:MAG: TatD family hydrolase [Candidatus Peribacteria bacterium]
MMTAMAQLEQLYEAHKSHIVAIGECGLDAHYPGYQDNKDLQLLLFDLQCALARKLQLPIVIHSREQFSDTLQILKEYTDLKIYMHCR